MGNERHPDLGPRHELPRELARESKSKSPADHELAMKHSSGMELAFEFHITKSTIPDHLFRVVVTKPFKGKEVESVYYLADDKAVTEKLETLDNLGYTIQSVTLYRKDEQN